jgi:O-antigen ligase
MTHSWRAKAGSFLFFGSLIVVLDPFTVIPEQTKFSIFLAAQIVGAALLTRDYRRLGSVYWPGAALIALYLIALVRIAETESYSVLQGILTIATFALATFTAKDLSVPLMRRAILIALLPAAAMIALNFDYLSDPMAQDWFTLGDFSYQAYQGTAFVLGMVGLAALGEVDPRRSTVRNGLFIALFLGASYFVFHSIARGEGIAFIIGAMLIIAPRLTIIAAPFSWSLLKLATFAFDLPLTDRFRLFFEGDYGLRDLLFSFATHMIYANPVLLLWGGGLGSFQKYYGLPLEMYPHNMILEALIVGGVPLFAVFVIIFIVPIIRVSIISFQQRLPMDGRYAFALMVYLVLIGMKSGTILSMWSIMLFAGVFKIASSAPLGRRHPRQLHIGEQARPVDNAMPLA